MKKLQVKEDEFIMEGTANDVTQKVVGNGQFRRVVDKTPEEIAVKEKLGAIPVGLRPASITNAEWQNVLKKLKALEKG